MCYQTEVDVMAKELLVKVRRVTEDTPVMCLSNLHESVERLELMTRAMRLDMSNVYITKATLHAHIHRARLAA